MNESALIQMIPVGAIRVLNPRDRNKKKFEALVANIAHLGLKRPISVCPSRGGAPGEAYDLICGQGRLEAVTKLGWPQIPAVIQDLPYTRILCQSLVENLARGWMRPRELARQILLLRERGYSNSEIAQKIDYHVSHICAMIRLLENGGAWLLDAVEKKQIKISAALLIATTPDQELQSALAEAYEKKQLVGRELLHARRLAEQRRLRGKTPLGRAKGGQVKAPTSDAIVRAYKQEVARQQLMVKKAKICETRLIFVISALRQLYADDNFVRLLRAEGLDSLPRYLSEQIQKGGAA